MHMKKKRKVKAETVFNLIKKMSQPEKRYFKLNNQSYNKNKDFINLFDYLNAQKVFNAKDLEQSFEHKNISSTVNYLHNKIVDILEEKGKKMLSSGIPVYDEDIEYHIKTSQVYLYAELLELALEEIQKAEEIALRRENYVYLIRICQINKKMFNSTHLNHYKYGELVAESNRKLKWALEQYLLVNEMATLTNIITWGGGINSDDYQEAMQKVEAYAERIDELPFVCKRAIIKIRTFHYIEKQEYTEALNLFLQAIKHWESLPYERWKLGDYIVNWYNLLFISVGTSHDLMTDYFREYVELPEKHPKTFKLARPILLRTYNLTKYSAELMLILEQREYEKIYDIEQNFTKGLPDLLDLSQWGDVVQRIFLNMILVHLILKNYERSNHWIEQYYEFSQPDSPWDITCQILDVITHYDQGNYVYLESKMRNLNRKWQKEKLKGTNAPILLKLIQKTLLKSKQNKIPEIWKEGLHELYQAEKILTDYNIALSRWVEMKIQK